MSSERHLREARELLGGERMQRGDAGWVADVAAALRAAELRGVRAGLAAAAAATADIDAAPWTSHGVQAVALETVDAIDPASVDIPEEP